MRTLVELEKLESRLGGQRLKEALRGFEEDLLTMQECEKNAGASVAQRLTLGNGLVRRITEGLRIVYHGSAGVMAKVANIMMMGGGEEDLKLDGMDGVLSASLGAEDAFPEKKIVTGSQGVGAVTDGEAPLPLEFSFAADSSASMNAVFVLRLDPPVVCSVPLAASLAALANPNSNDSPIASSEKGTRLQKLLLPDLFGAVSGEPIGNVALPDDSVIAFSHSVDDFTLGATISRVPILHPRDVLVALRLLRQQAVFNELFTSCCRKASDTTDASRHTVILPTEVTRTATRDRAQTTDPIRRALGHYSAPCCTDAFHRPCSPSPVKGCCI